MSNVVSLRGFKNRTRKAYMVTYGTQIDHFLERFIQSHIEADFRQMAVDYQAGRYAGAQESWDYVHFREILVEAMDEVYGPVLYAMLGDQRWFDRRLVSREEVVDRCLSLYIMHECQYAITSK